LLRRSRAPVAKGVLAFNVLNSAGYAAVAFARAGPFERDTRGMADSIAIDERAVGALVLAAIVVIAVSLPRSATPAPSTPAVPSMRMSIAVHHESWSTP